MGPCSNKSSGRAFHKPLLVLAEVRDTQFCPTESAERVTVGRQALNYLRVALRPVNRLRTPTEEPTPKASQTVTC